MALTAQTAQGLSAAICLNPRAQGVTKNMIYLSISTAGLTDTEMPSANSAVSAVKGWGTADRMGSQIAEAGKRGGRSTKTPEPVQS